MVSPIQRESSTQLPVSHAPSPQPQLQPQPFRKQPSRIVRWRRKCYLSLLSTCILVNGILSPAMTGLISHILAVTHDQVPKYGGDFKRGSSYLVAASGAVGVFDACVLFVMSLIGDDMPLRWNWSGKEKHREWKLPVHRIATLVALAAVLRGAAAAAYSNYDYWESDQGIEQNLENNGTYYTPETWICTGAVNQTIIEGEHPEYKWMCREAQGARYLSILVTIVAGITLLLVLWRWRRRNLDRQYEPVANSRRASDVIPFGAVDSGRRSEQGSQHYHSNSSTPPVPQEVVGREVYEMPADTIHEMEHHPMVRDSDGLSIQGEPTEYFAHDHRRGNRWNSDEEAK
ncbi:hypothetical protein BFW01_g1146 [Lasiodiplodia theobromae]|uniref:Uncharacterized protein n=2 Tax=Lasiodiplodia TaxID=66739 RepID=A0A8H7IRA1_9PEZI|nr:hypothetical protein BFW01_g1146 [Lasiodiplodia theobromae]KAK0653312.1 hypothetical protein DIS24_g6104 [Lasiodiplodia hormozganensis]